LFYHHLTVEEWTAMKTILCTTQLMAQWLRWIARGISTLAAAFWLLILLDILACDALVGFICVNREMAFLAGFVIASVLSVLIAWRREYIGGFVMILWGLAFAAIAYVTSRPQQVFSMLVSGVPFLLSGSLFLVSGWLSPRQDG
jgi:hypothetical protein